MCSYSILLVLYVQVCISPFTMAQWCNGSLQVSSVHRAVHAPLDILLEPFPQHLEGHINQPGSRIRSQVHFLSRVSVRFSMGSWSFMLQGRASWFSCLKCTKCLSLAAGRARGVECSAHEALGSFITPALLQKAVELYRACTPKALLDR